MRSRRKRKFGKDPNWELLFYRLTEAVDGTKGRSREAVDERNDRLYDLLEDISNSLDRDDRRGFERKMRRKGREHKKWRKNNKVRPGSVRDKQHENNELKEAVKETADEFVSTKRLSKGALFNRPQTSESKRKVNVEVTADVAQKAQDERHRKRKEELARKAAELDKKEKRLESMNKELEEARHKAALAEQVAENKADKAEELVVKAEKTENEVLKQQMEKEKMEIERGKILEKMVNKAITLFEEKMNLTSQNMRVYYELQKTYIDSDDKKGFDQLKTDTNVMYTSMNSEHKNIIDNFNKRIKTIGEGNKDPEFQLSRIIDDTEEKIQKHSEEIQDDLQKKNDLRKEQFEESKREAEALARNLQQQQVSKEEAQREQEKLKKKQEEEDAREQKKLAEDQEKERKRLSNGRRQKEAEKLAKDKEIAAQKKQKAELARAAQEQRDKLKRLSNERRAKEAVAKAVQAEKEFERKRKEDARLAEEEAQLAKEAEKLAKDQERERKRLSNDRRQKEAEEQAKAKAQPKRKSVPRTEEDKKVLIFDLDDTLTENCVNPSTEQGSDAYKYVMDLLRHAQKKKWPVYVVTSRHYDGFAGAPDPEDNLLTFEVVKPLADLLRTVVGKKNLYYIKSDKDLTDAVVRTGDKEPTGALKMVQIAMIIQENAGVPYKNFIFFDDAEHNKRSWEKASKKSTALRALTFIGGNGECVLTQKNRDKADKFFGRDFDTSPPPGAAETEEPKRRSSSSNPPANFKSEIGPHPASGNRPNPEGKSIVDTGWYGEGGENGFENGILTLGVRVKGGNQGVSAANKQFIIAEKNPNDPAGSIRFNKKLENRMNNFIKPTFPVIGKPAVYEFKNKDPLNPADYDINKTYLRFGGYNNVFSEKDNTEKVYQDLIRPNIEDVAKSKKDVTIFAYGESGSGKTFTLLGDRNNKGVIQYALNDLQSLFGLSDLRVAAIQIYKGDVYNAIGTQYGLKPGNMENVKKQYFEEDEKNEYKYLGEKLPVLEPFNKITKGVIAPNQRVHEVGGIIESMSQTVSTKGIGRWIDENIIPFRPVRSTKLNPESSRSHLFIIFYFMVNGELRKFTIADFAGKEKKLKNEPTAKIQEGESINKTNKHLRILLQTYISETDPLSAIVPNGAVLNTYASKPIVPYSVKGGNVDKYNLSQPSETLALLTIMKYITGLFPSSPDYAPTNIILMLMVHKYGYGWKSSKDASAIENAKKTRDSLNSANFLLFEVGEDILGGKGQSLSFSPQFPDGKVYKVPKFGTGRFGRTRRKARIKRRSNRRKRRTSNRSKRRRKRIRSGTKRRRSRRR